MPLTPLANADLSVTELLWDHERLTGGSITPLLTHLIEQKRLSRAEIRRLRDLLNRGKP